MVGHGFQFNDCRQFLLADFCDDLFEPAVDVAGNDVAAIFRAPHDVVGAVVGDVVVRPDLIREQDYMVYCCI